MDAGQDSRSRQTPIHVLTHVLPTVRVHEPRWSYPQVAPPTRPCLRALRFSGGGGGVETAGDEEHPKPVVVVVGEPSRDATGEFDEPVHRFGAAVG